MPVSFIYSSCSCAVTLGRWSLELLCLPFQPPWLITGYSLVACHSSDFNAGRLLASELQTLFIWTMTPPPHVVFFSRIMSHIQCLPLPFRSVTVSQTFIFLGCYHNVDIFFLSNTRQVCNRIEIAALEVIYQLQHFPQRSELGLKRQISYISHSANKLNIRIHCYAVKPGLSEFWKNCLIVSHLNKGSLLIKSLPCLNGLPKPMVFQPLEDLMQVDPSKQIPKDYYYLVGMFQTNMWG